LVGRKLSRWKLFGTEGEAGDGATLEKTADLKIRRGILRKNLRNYDTVACKKEKTVKTLEDQLSLTEDVKTIEGKHLSPQFSLHP
jgi:hypothetical protein